MKRVRWIDHELTNRLLNRVLPAMPLEARLIASSVQIYVTRCRAGRACWRNGVIRIPAWVFDPTVNFCGKGFVPGGDQFASYYLAHEMAHVKARTGDHRVEFMIAFKELCHEKVQWYETIYKPRNAALGGINNKENIK